MQRAAKKCFIGAAIAIVAGTLVMWGGPPLAEAWAQTGSVRQQETFGNVPAIMLWHMLSGTLMPLGVALIGAGVVIQALQGGGGDGESSDMQ